ncbi:hypothetical protein EZS27_035771 [termite gut metagenome]|uniref:DUF3823 domain-containing protein n=1 Tax=termite gut metagenome TaxID=433724 RepID=A0A5J4PX95_9ZZZZ
MNTILKYCGVPVMALLFSACEIDNYKEGDGIISGTVTDSITGRLLSSEQPNGYIIYCTELSWTETANKGSQSFFGKADGTFYNCRIFKGTYSVAPRNGPFHAVTSQEVEIRSKKETKVDFKVLPYCSFSDVTIEKDPVDAKAIITTFKLNVHELQTFKTNTETGETETIISKATPRNYKLFATSRSPFVGINIYDDAVSSGDIAFTEVDLNTTLTIRRTGFQKGKTYYIRLGARCSETPESRYNMTDIVKLEF